MGLWNKLRDYLANRGNKGDSAARKQQEYLEEFARTDGERIAGYQTFTDAYDGKQQVDLDDRTRDFLEATGIPWSENFCETILDALANRLQISAWTSGAQGGEAVAEWANDFWKGDRQAEVAGTIHHQTPLLGDGFLAVGWADELGEPAFYWNDPSCCTPFYNAEGQLVAVSKVWNTGDVTPTNPDGRWIQRLNLYLPDRVEKWFTLAGTGQRNWAMHLDPTDQVWPTPWVRPDGTPRGVALIHFRHKAKGRTFGRSHLRGVVPQQALLNKQVADLTQILDYQAWRQRWVTGMSGEKVDELDYSPGSLLWAESDKAKFGDFAADDPRGALEAIASTLKRMGARSGTPLHLIGGTGELPSGESLKTAAEPMTVQVKAEQPSYGGNWARAMGIAAGLEADFGSYGLTYDSEQVAASWVDPTPRNRQGEAETAEVLGRVGVSRKTRLGELGYDADEEERLLEEESETDAARREREFAAGTGA